ncbi:WD40 repeat domain-containing protein [Corallococcus sicarius]|uniref:WD40 repeat domain-containing protein n=1 Tax=Corallococcus sicarius TaxID=2316726 RepID=A0A3A8NX54_9BACT|nr:WD40 repeat domain-containing protein [Corallococcus sicarius]RKH44064.1 WD40 repeat domain-containing protein [Corallococcus sicarius]
MPSALLTPDTAKSLALLRRLGDPERNPPVYQLQWLGWDASSRYLLSVLQRGRTCLRWWDLQSDQHTPLVTLPLPGAMAAWFLPGAQRILSVTVQGALQTWAVSDGSLLSMVETGRSLTGAHLSVDGTRLLLTAAGRVLLWDLQRSWLVWRREDPAYLYGCALSPDGRFAAAGAAEEQPEDRTRATIRLWDARTGQPLATRSFDSSSRSWTVAFAPSGEWLVAGTSAGELLCLGLPDLDVVRVIEGPGAGAIHVEFNREGSLLAVSADTTAFEVHAVQDGRVLYSDSDLDDMQLSTVAFSPDGRFVSWGLDESRVGIWGVVNARRGPG